MFTGTTASLGNGKQEERSRASKILEGERDGGSRDVSPQAGSLQIIDAFPALSINSREGEMNLFRSRPSSNKPRSQVNIYQLRTSCQILHCPSITAQHHHRALAAQVNDRLGTPHARPPPAIGCAPNNRRITALITAIFLTK